MSEAETAERAPIGPFSPFGLSVVAGTVVLDQAAKWAAESWLAFGEPVPVLPVLMLFRTYNTGIAFSLFDELGSLPLIALALVISAVVLLVWWRSRESSRAVAAGYGLIVGGALGNLIDRVLHGHVIDFLLLHLGDRTLFVFNLADAALTLGPAMLILFFLLRRAA